MYKLASLLTALLFLAPPIGADTPDHPDADGDLASGPVGIEGVSTDSGDQRFRFDLHVDALDPNQPATIYWFHLDADGLSLHWECLVRGIDGILSLDCDLVEQGTQAMETYKYASDRVRTLPSAGGANYIPTQHHVSLADSTIGFTAAYVDLGLQYGDVVTLERGAAYYQERPRRLDVPADTIIVDEEIVVQ